MDISPSPFPDREQQVANRAAKREALLLAAVRMFNERGFHATSLDDVAGSLGISKPTIYHYLGNKDRVLLECVTIGLQQLREAADAASLEQGRGIDRLRSFLVRYVRINMDDFGRCVIRTGDEALAPESAKQFRALKREIDTAMRALIRAGIEDESIAGSVDPKLLAFTLAGALNWPARWYDPAGAHAPETIAEQMVGMLMTGVLPR